MNGWPVGVTHKKESKNGRSSSYQQKIDLAQIDPRAMVQTGPGMPVWGGHTISLRWSGPVEKSQRLRLWLLSPKVNLVLAFLRVAEFEQLMSRLAEGRSVVALLRQREKEGKHRRMDQLIHEGGLPQRLPFLDEEHARLVSAIRDRLFAASAA